MLEGLAGAALRSLVLAALVRLGLCGPRLRHPQIQFTAWVVVLAASLLMPVATELSGLLPSPTVRVSIPLARVADLSTILPAHATEPAVLPAPSAPASAPAGRMSWRDLALALYFLVAGVMILRLGVSLARAACMVRRATPLRAAWTAGRDVRVSRVIRAPVTFGSVILLPSDHARWTMRQRAAVLAHEAAHVWRRDWLVQVAARLNCALFWFSPLGWWLARRLSELAEQASDDAAIADLHDRPAYAAILLDISRRVRAPASVVAMARPATLAARIERILAETARPSAIRPRMLAVLATILVALALAVAHPLRADTLAQSSGLEEQQAPHRRIAIDPTRLDADVGTYEDKATGSVMAVTRDGDHLLTSRTEMPGVPEYAYSPTRFFLTISAEENEFVADASGKVVRVIHTKNGLETVLERIDAPTAHTLQTAYENRLMAELAPRTPISLPADALDAFVGNYQLTPGYIFTVTREGSQLYVQGTGRRKYPVYPYGKRDFFYTAAAAQLSFRPDALVLHQDGRDREAPKVDDAAQDRLAARLAEELKPHMPVAVDGAVLSRYAGRYADGTVTMTIVREGDHLLARVSGYNRYPVFPYTGQDFFATEIPAQLSFVRDGKGNPTALVRHEHGEDLVLARQG